MLNIRMVVPSAEVGSLLPLLAADPCVVNLVHLPGASMKPAGDLVTCDVPREEVSRLLALVHRVEGSGSIVLESVDTAMGDVMDEAKQRAEGAEVDAVIWEQIEAQVDEEAELSVTFCALLVIAALIGAVGIVLDSPILIVGAMVVGPEFGPLAGVSVALVQRRPAQVRRSLLALAVGFPIAIAAAAGAGVVLRAADLLPEIVAARRPLTGFIARPDGYSFVVAVLAGAAGMISLTSSRSGALIGVLISVTTIPAAANMGLAAANADVHDFAFSGLQLVVNVAGIVLAGVAVLSLQRKFRR